MRKFITFCVSIVLFSTILTAAEAGRGGGVSTSQKLYHVWDVTADGKTESEVSLCEIHNHYGFMFIPFWTSIEDDYVLSKDRCTGDEYYNIKPEFKEALNLIMPADLPKQPEISALDRAKESWGAFLALGFIGFAAIRKKAG